eukprot:gene6589-13328_t
MGSASSCPNREVDKDKTLAHTTGKCQFHSVDRFLQLILLQLPREVAIKAIVENPIAFTTFVDFLAMQIICGENTSEFITITNDHPTSLRFETVCNLFRTSLLNAYSCSIVVGGDEQSPQSQLVSLSSQMFPSYLISLFFNNWRLRETSSKVFHSSLDEDTAQECTLPELETVYSISEKSNSVSGKAEVVDSSIETIPILSIQNSFKTSSVPNIPIGILLSEIENTTLSSDSTSYSSINDNPISHREKILRNCDQIELSNLLRSDKCGWITAFITASETLPIGITLSSISRERPGYPVMYLNKHFIENCGHNRDDVLGERFGFMQRPGSTILPHSEYEVMNASLALSSGRNMISRIDICRHEIVNTTLVATKHIFDTFQNNKFVIGLHMEVQSKVEVHKYMHLLQKLIFLLPSSTC